MKLLCSFVLPVAVCVVLVLGAINSPAAVAQTETKEGKGEPTTEEQPRRDPVTGQFRSPRGSEEVENVKAPVPIDKPPPRYTKAARKAKLEGAVVLYIVVDARGKVIDARVVKPLGMGLDESALETVWKWKFRPGTRNGTPVAVRVKVEVTFQLHK